MWFNVSHWLVQNEHQLSILIPLLIRFSLVGNLFFRALHNQIDSLGLYLRDQISFQISLRFFWFEEDKGLDPLASIFQLNDIYTQKSLYKSISISNFHTKSHLPTKKLETTIYLTCIQKVYIYISMNKDGFL